jgi:hypothetical protein
MDKRGESFAIYTHGDILSFVCCCCSEKGRKEAEASEIYQTTDKRERKKSLKFLMTNITGNAQCRKHRKRSVMVGGK